MFHLVQSSPLIGNTHPTVLIISVPIAEKDCRVSVTGQEYLGKVSTNNRGMECLAWAKLRPEQYDAKWVFFHNETSLEDVGNYCRNPSNSEEGPWCFHGNGKDDKSACEVDFCVGMSCK